MLREPILSPRASFQTVQANRAYRLGLINTDLLASWLAITSTLMLQWNMNWISELSTWGAESSFVIHSYFRSLLTHHHDTAQSNAANIGCFDSWDFEKEERERERDYGEGLLCNIFLLVFWFMIHKMGVWGRAGSSKVKKYILLKSFTAMPFFSIIYCQ